MKRLLIYAAGFNLALLVRKQYGIGKPRTLQGVESQILCADLALLALYAATWLDWDEVELIAA